jgi:hypothetical protein
MARVECQNLLHALLIGGKYQPSSCPLARLQETFRADAE